MFPNQIVAAAAGFTAAKQMAGKGADTRALSAAQVGAGPHPSSPQRQNPPRILADGFKRNN
jgi:hypothetical protein